MLTEVGVEIAPREDGAGFRFRRRPRRAGPTGVESRRRWTAASVAALTIYDMVKPWTARRRSATSALSPRARAASRAISCATARRCPRRSPPRPPRAAPAVAASAGARRPSVRAMSTKARRRRAPPIRAPGVPQLSATTAFRSAPGRRMPACRSASSMASCTGRVGRLPRDAEEKLARAANATVGEVFGSE